MKRLVLSLVLLGAVLLVCYYGVSFVTSTYKEITNQLDLGTEYAKNENFKAAREHIKKAEKLYTSREQFMAAFVNHGILDEIGQTISGVAPLANKDSLPEFFSLMSEAKTALAHLRNDHIFLIGNLF